MVALMVIYVDEKKRRVPEVRFEGFTEPWDAHRLGQIASITDTKHATAPVASVTTQYKMIRTSCISDGFLLEHLMNSVAKDTYESWSERIVLKEDDLVFSREAPIGEVAVIPKSTNRFFLGQRMVGIRLYCWNSLFLKYQMYAPKFRNEIRVRNAASTTVANFGISDICMQEFTFPSNEEQTAIGNFFRSLDDTIALEKQQYNKMVSVKKSMLEKMFPKKGATVPEIRFDGFTETWEQRKLIDIAPLQRGYDLPQSNMDVGNYPVVMSNGVLHYHNEFKAIGPGVVTGRSGTIGKVHYIKENYWPHNTSLWVTDFKGNLPLFIFYLFGTLDFSRFGTGSGVPTLNRNHIHEKYSYIPSFLDEQTAIGNFFRNLDDLIHHYSQSIEKLQNIKKACLCKMFV